MKIINDLPTVVVGLVETKESNKTFVMETGNPLALWIDPEKGMKGTRIRLREPGDWQILGLCDQVTEDQAKSMITEIDGDPEWMPTYNDPDSGGRGIVWPDFKDEHSVVTTAKEALFSLLEREGMNKETTLILIKHK